MGEIRESGTCMHMVTFDRALSANEKLNQETSATKLQNIVSNVRPNERLEMEARKLHTIFDANIGFMSSLQRINLLDVGVIVKNK